MKTKLSERVRPDMEAAPWVIEEIRRLENDFNALKNALHRISLGSQSSMTSKEDLGWDALAALSAALAAEEGK